MVKIDFPDANAGIHSIFQFGLSVPDLDEEARFLTAFGLDVVRRQDRLEIHTNGGDHVWAHIVKSEGEKKKLLYVSVGCYETDYAQIRSQVEEAGGVPSNGHPAGPAGGFWFKDPDGTLIQVLVAEKTQPDEKSKMTDMNVPANVRGARPARSRPR